MFTLSEYTGGSNGWGTMISRCSNCGEIVSEYECDSDGIPTDAIFDIEDSHICNDDVEFDDIPNDVIAEIRFMFGSEEECMSDYLKPILESHGYSGNGFLVIDPEDDKELTIDIYEKLFVTGICEPF